MAYTVKCFGVVDETQIQWHSLFPALLNDVPNVGYLISDPSSFTEPCPPTNWELRIIRYAEYMVKAQVSADEMIRW